MSESYRWQVKEEIIRSLREELTFVPEPGDSCKRIMPTNIVFRKVSVSLRQQDKGFTLEPVFPGIILSTPLTEFHDPAKGESAHDEAVYRWLIQIIDSDNYEPEENIRTYWKWSEQIWRWFNGNTMCNVPAFKTLCWSRQVDNVDEKMWLKDENFVTGIEIHVQVWMTRGES